MKEIKSVVSEICSRALEGTLTLDEFCALWPQFLFTTPFYYQIYDDLEYGIEHTPGFFFKRGIDYEAWIDSDAYLRIFLDSVLLNYNKDVDTLQQCRNFVLQDKNLTKEIIQNSVEGYFNQQYKPGA